MIENIETGHFGTVCKGISIMESNRATVYETTEEGVNCLKAYMVNNYITKGVKAVLFGITISPFCQEQGWEDKSTQPEVKYAVFVQNGFLKEV